MAALETLQAWLADAEAAYQAISLGKKAETIEVDGKRITYSKVDVLQLSAYIARLKREIAAGSASQCTSRQIYVRN
ncbi:MAG: gpW family head-tail joining protein [Rhodospirillales bacterium]|jgi:hypothetical protein